MELKPGDILQVSMDERGIHLSSKVLALRRAQDMVCKYIATDVSLADELIAERRAEAKHEQAG